MKNLLSIVLQVKSLILLYLPKILIALVVLFIGLKLINFMKRFIDKGLNKKGFDPTIRPFLISLISMTLKMALLISLASMVGVKTASFVAVLGAAGLAIGLSLQGSLSNFAGGVLLLLFKPIRVGDYIEAQGHGGTVKEIQIFCTILTTPDNKTVIIPNAGLSNGSIINYSIQPTRRVDMVFGIGYNDDIYIAKMLLGQVLDEDERILKDPVKQVFVQELSESSIDLGLRAWVNKEDYFSVLTETQEKVKHLFDKEGISFPYPKRDIHIYGQTKEI
jgi:small conductance mechanosensitive channel